MDTYVQIRKTIIDNIPVLICNNGEKNQKGNIILLHKLLEDKEHEILLAYYLAQSGYEVLIPDLLYHGESPLSVRISKKMDFNKLYTEMDKSIELIRRLMEDISDRKIGLIGSSYGGMLALAAGGILDGISFVGAICSSPNWAQLLKSGNIESFRMFSSNRPVIDYQIVQESIRKYDPMYHIDGFEGKDIMLMNGALDTTFKYCLTQPFYKELSERCDKKKHSSITWKKYDKTGHSVTYDMIQDLLEWLKQL